VNILIKGPLDTMSGYGNDVSGLVRAFTDVGLDTHIKPVSVIPPIDQVSAVQLTKYPDIPFDIGLVYQDPAALRADDIRNACRKTVAWSMWEYETYREDLSGGAGIPLMTRLADFDLFLVTDSTSLTALSPYAKPMSTPIRKLAGGFRSDQWKPVARDWSAEPFRFGMLGRLDRRKGPWLAIGAFMALKAEHGKAFNAELHLKTTLPGMEAVPHPDLHVHREWWPQAKVAEFYGSLHCLLAPSTGEGKNVPALEAMATGCPVIATDYGGHKEWMQSDWAYPLDYEAFEYPQGVAAKPSISHLAKLMWEVYTERGTARRKGEVASNIIPAMCDWKQVVHRFLAMEELR
jgi:glycosyltransferase involved in cell wall biosynthesis